MNHETSQNILRDVLNASRECILVVDPSMRISIANRVAMEVFGNRYTQLEARRLSEIVRDPALHEAFRTAVADDHSTDLKIELIAAERRSFDVHVGPILLDGVSNAIGAFYEITKIEKLERMRQEFLSNISHELRTPLTSILAYVETLEDGAVDDHENNRRFLGVIRRNAERMHALIADVAELSQIETGNISLDVKDVRVAPIVNETFTALTAKAAGRRIALINEVVDDTSVRVDPMRLEQMLTNLIDNAIKFNRESGSVTVRASANGRKKYIYVVDTGDGIVPENLQRIFERFYRIDRGRTREVGGTGLGLAIVKHLARLHGGDVSASSVLGQGTTFTIELPVE
ncbi:MAG TPA: ATP-binding protein [Pyrinomonadaceae bacterium]|nr:ATP-binding protein [Pyrinomonadaceae bacterium]